ncbi:MAG: hypothetical protein ACYTGN_10175 [Planctomycetota bacterium]|jgi:hypothetical protein
MNRVSYDRWWGLLLLLTCAMPVAADGPSWILPLVAGQPDVAISIWLVLGTLTGLAAFALGLGKSPARWRHFTNFALGSACLAMPLFDPEIWQAFPYANPALLPLSGLEQVGWVMLVGFGALYAGSGVRVVRPSQPLGQAIGALGAFLLCVFAFLPTEVQSSASPYAVERLGMLATIQSSWRDLAPFLLIATGVVCGVVNLTRTPFEIVFAKLTRLLLVAGLLFWIALPFLETNAPLAGHLPVAWGTLRLLGPFFLAVDGVVAFLAISITRDAT